MDDSRRTLATLGVVVALVIVASSADAQTSASTSIPRLGLEAFPDVPPTVREALRRRGCRVPQSYGQRQPHNLIAGSFTDAGRREWAVLCSVRDTSTIVVVSQAGVVVDSLERSADAASIEQMPDLGPVYVRRLNRVSPAQLRSAPHDPEGPNAPRQVDHDAIKVVHDGKGSSTIYKTAGRWMQVGACC
jgi:hypothetical protein